MITPFFTLIGLIGMSCFLSAQEKMIQQDNSDLLTQYIHSKGNRIISFDTSNIKQFWTDKSVAARKDSFEIVLKQGNAQRYKSIPLKIQLANVNEAQDCRIEVIAINDDIAFSILNDKKRTLSVSSPEDKFIQYNIISSFFHLEDTQKTAFSIVFDSQNEKTLSIKKIILSFSHNPNSIFLASPGEVKFTKDTMSPSLEIIEQDDGSFSATGKRTTLLGTKKILIDNNTLSCSVTIKNTGDASTSVFIGYKAFDQNQTWINGKCYPFQNKNTILNILSSKENDDKIFVDTYPDWTKNCFLALNAKDDMSDIPNFLFAGKITDIKEFENGQAEITLDKPLKSKIKEGTKARVHSTGGAYLYTNRKTLRPGDEEVFTSTITKDNSFLQYSPTAFSRGVYYVVPVILSNSIDSSKENTIQISNFIISY